MDAERERMERPKLIEALVAAEAAIAARDALLDQALELTAPHARIHEWDKCYMPAPCPVEQWRRAVTELRGGTHE